MEAVESYVSLYRKYRPGTFDSVVGQETVVRILQGSVDSGRISHAYLFAGPKGTGKTTVARILAKALNCEKGPTSHPCMECEHCRAITAGNDIDVIEIDAASNRGIDEIRDLRESTRFVPARSRKKIFIIDEAHMLTVQAFNALLKTLEEPPDYVVFILATTEPQKLPETILSRCQRFDFKRIPDTAMLQCLKTIRDKEAPHITDDALCQMVELSDGSMRGAIGLVDQFSVFGEEPVTAAAVLDLLGLPTEENLALLVETLLNRDAKAMVSVLDQLDRSGVEPADLLERTIALISGYLLKKAAGPRGTAEDRIARRLGYFPDAALMDIVASFARIQQQSASLADPSPLVQAFLLAMAQGLPFGNGSAAVAVTSPVSSVVLSERTAPMQEKPAASPASASPAPAASASESSVPAPGPVSEPWEQFKSLVAETSKPISVMLQALDVQEVSTDGTALHILLGPKTKLFRAVLDQKRDEVLVPAAKTVYHVEKVLLTEKDDPGAETAVSTGEVQSDDKLELLKKTFDATESLF